MFLFLDFDGVLRPDWARRGHFHPPCLERFESVMRDFPNVDIVISSDWRWQARLSTIVAMFSPDVGARIVGVTPVLPVVRAGERYLEILQYLREHGTARTRADGACDEQPRWLAIDDTPELFPAAGVARHVLLTDPTAAIDAAFEVRLRRALWSRQGR